MFTILFIFAAGLIGGTVAARVIRDRPQDGGDVRDLRERVYRLEQTIETMSGEVEKVAEAQRFMTALLEDRGRSQPVLRRPDAESSAS